MTTGSVSALCGALLSIGQIEIITPDEGMPFTVQMSTRGVDPCQTGGMTAVPDALRAEVIRELRDVGARFALLHGSRAACSHRPDSDVDVAAWWARGAPSSFEVLLPAGVDLVVLNDAPLELAGRIAMQGQILFDDDPPARVRWVATTRKIYADEQPRLRRSHREFAESVRRGR